MRDADDGGSTDGPIEVDARACASELAPERPSADDDGTKTVLSFAVSDLRLDTNAKRDAGIAPGLGLDLDRTCTCPEENSCTRPDADAPSCDGDGGRDNALGALFSQLSAAIPQLRDDFATERIQEGGFTFLIDVTGWNGRSNDPAVGVTVRMSPGFDQAVYDGGRTVPFFDRFDVWLVDPASILAGDTLVGTDCRSPGAVLCFAKIADSNAYVRDDMLVARIAAEGSPTSRFVVPTRTGRLVFDLADTTLIAKLSKGENGYRMSGEILGRCSVESVLATMANSNSPFVPDASFCQGGTGPGTGYSLMKTGVCESLDIALEPARDGRGAPCNAISTSMAFSASEGVAGHVASPETAAPPCGDWKDDCSH